jgi:hypothetical protein
MNCGLNRPNCLILKALMLKMRFKQIWPVILAQGRSYDLPGPNFRVAVIRTRFPPGTICSPLFSNWSLKRGH